jgi:hypothetical protein
MYNNNRKEDLNNMFTFSSATENISVEHMRNNDGAHHYAIAFPSGTKDGWYEKVGFGF